MAARCAEFGVPPAAAALGFPAAPPGGDRDRAALRSVAEVETSQRHAEVEIPAELGGA